MRSYGFLFVSAVFQTVSAFVPTSIVKHAARELLQDSTSRAHASLNLLDPASMMDITAVMDGASNFLQSSSNLLAFTDQGQNLAGIFFQASLLPYLIFLYFLSFRANKMPALGNFGFQFVLVFVLSTIPSGIISKATYGESLANVDWMHGGAELLLTIANILIVLGFTEAFNNQKEPSEELFSKGRNIAFGAAGIFAAALALGPSLGFEAHSPFLAGIGNLPESLVVSLPWVSHTDPVNSLSIPTWAIHFSSVFEYLFAMNLVWRYSEVSGNPSWKGLTWGMLPLHASGVCACTYHFFYNPAVLQFLVSMQAGLTLLGNLTCGYAAYRIAKSNGWTLDEVNPFPRGDTDPRGLIADGLAAMPLEATQETDSPAILAGKLAALTVVSSYLVKYGELGFDIPFTPNAPLALALVLGVPGITAYYYGRQSKDTPIFENLPGLGGEGESSLSFQDVKKFGVAGTVAYVITELAFWIVAFPAAAYALYNSTGHWPDVINDGGDRAAVFAFIFAGANVARAFVPVRLGAALALAPWVDENILGGKSDSQDDVTVDSVQAKTN